MSRGVPILETVVPHLYASQQRRIFAARDHAIVTLALARLHPVLLGVRLGLTKRSESTTRLFNPTWERRSTVGSEMEMATAAAIDAVVVMLPDDHGLHYVVASWHQQRLG